MARKEKRTAQKDEARRLSVTTGLADKEIV